MELITGALNKRWLHNLVAHHTSECTEVVAAIAYASADNLELFEACKRHSKPVRYYGRYDESVPVAPAVVKWFLGWCGCLYRLSQPHQSRMDLKH